MYKSYSMELAGRTLTVDIGRVAKQANGAALMHYGDTTVLATATASKEPREGIDFFPLSVEYEEKMYAVGKIPGGFNKREGKASEHAILTSRVIDRPMRPLFPKDYRNDVTLVDMVMSVDPECNPEIPAMLGSSLATCISDIPFDGPCATTQIGLINGEYVVNPTLAQKDISDLQLTVASTRDKVIMIEAGANEVPEDQMIEAIYKAHEVNQEIIRFFDQIIAECGKEKHSYESCAVPQELFDAIKEIVPPEEMEVAVFSDDKQTRENNIAEITGGTFTAASDANTETYGIYNCGCGAGIDLGTLTVSGGTFTGATYAVAEVSSQNAIVNISGGQFAGTKAAIIKSSTSNATIAISGGTFSSDPSVYVVGNGNTNIVKRAGSEGAYTYTVLAKSDLTSGVYLTDPSGALASNYYVSSTANGVWTVSYSAPSSGGGSSSSSRRYDVSAPSVKHGDVTVSPKSASKGDTVTITVKPDSGYELDTLTVKDASGSKIKVKDKGDGKFTFTMPASKVTVSAEFAEIETLDFADVPTDAYYYEAVKWAAKKGITGGIGNGLFGPNQPCTRAQIVTFLWRAAGSPEPKTMSSFADVSMDAYYAKAVAWAVENGITTGTGDGKFSPDATCTRAQSVTFLFRAIGKLVDSKAEFSDVLADSYYANAVDWAVENGVTNGIGDGLFGPDNSCTRAQIVTFLYRAYQGK